MTLLDEYHEYLSKYKEKYGEKTIVLMMVGSFYEAYGVNSEKEKYGCDEIIEIGNLLNIIVTRKNKSIIENSKSNHLLMGFPLYCLNKYVEILIEENYTVVVISQVTPPPNPKREVTNIFSPSTYIENIQTYEEKYLMTIYLSKYFNYRSKTTFINCSIAIYDITTSKSYIYESPNNITDNNLILDEIFRIKQTYYPKEVIIFGDLIDNLSFEKIINFLELSSVCVHNNLNNFPKELLNLNYQNEILKKVFPNTGILTPIEYCNLEKNPNSVVSYVNLLKFIYEHDSNNLKCVYQPELLTANNKLILEFNTIKKLNIINIDNSMNSKNSSLLNILNNCISSNGKRFFKHCLLNPITDIKELEERYNNIDLFLKKDINSKYYIYDLIRKELQSIIDIERSFNKLSINKFHPFEFNILHNSIKKIIKLIEILEINNVNLLFNCDKEDYKLFLKYLEEIFNIEELPKYNLDNISESFYIEGYNKNIDTIQNELNKCNKYFLQLVHKLNSSSPDFSGFFKQDFNERDGNYLSITSKRFLQVKKKISSNFDISIDEYNDIFKNLIDKITPNKLTVKITSTNISKINDKIFELKNELKQNIMSLYNEICNNIYNKFNNLFKNTISFVNNIDFIANNASNSIKFNYNRPSIDKDADKSYFKATDLRHPIIEVINTKIPYISNNIKLGIENQDGIILYGCNSVGKSSTMKAIGLNLILAQAGMFVPSKYFLYSPYKSIFTRIPSSDDIFKGQSTFTVELSEFRNIQKKANKYSLIIGDELMVGTEFISGISLITAGIIELSKKQTSFIFASHLHELKNIEEIKEIKTLKIYHMTIHFDNITKDLIFDRKLKENGGPETYGLEIAKSYDFDNSFLKNAEKIKKKLLNENNSIIQNKKSRYNSNKFIDKCSICGDTKNLEIHHINQQKNADIHGNINKQFHKNILHNLVCLCIKCHDNIHNNNININGYKFTTTGIILDITKMNLNKLQNMRL